MKRFILYFVIVFITISITACKNSERPDTAKLAEELAGVSLKDEKEPTGNLFLDADVDYKPVMNGMNTDVIGKRASITVDKDAAINAQPSEFSRFVDERISGSGFNWWTIFFTDGTGLIFHGSNPSFCEYGITIDDGTIPEPIGYAVRGDSGEYTYSEYDN